VGFSRFLALPISDYAQSTGSNASISDTNGYNYPIERAINRENPMVNFVRDMITTVGVFVRRNRFRFGSLFWPSL